MASPDFEGARGSGEPGELVPRLVARVIDAILLVVIGVILGVMMKFNFAWLFLQSGLTFGYFVLLDTYQGATLGKQVMRLRVTAPGGGNPTLGQAAIREAFTLVGAIPFIGPLLSLGAWIGIAITISSSPTLQGQHDQLAGGTQVVKA